MSLRDEIEEFLTNNYTPTLYKGADKIIEIFEKRIDEMKQEYPTPELINDYSGNRYIMLCGIQEFYDKLKEILK